MKKYFLILTIIIISSIVNSKAVDKKPFEYPIQAIVQALIDHEQLQTYLHPEKNGRVPLVISGQGISRKLKLKKFGKKVQISENKQISGPHLFFTVFECKFENYCNVAFKYSVEGVTGSAGVFVNPDGTFKLEKTDINMK